jgi:tRNA threonylcarbamoyl adenosine modification protein YeaZ
VDGAVRDTVNGVWLGVDGATDVLALGIAGAEGVMRSAEPVDRRLAARLVPALDAFLASLAVERADLRGVVVGRGPGGTTGIRIATSFALGVARARGIPCRFGDSLAARAAACIPAGGQGVVAIAGRRGSAFVRRYAVDPTGGVTAQDALRESAITDLPPEAAASLQVAPDAGYLAAWAAAGGVGYGG